MKYCIAIGKETSPTIPLLLDGDFVKSMEMAKELGYHGVEIHTPQPELLDADMLNAACKRLDMFIATLGTGMIYSKYGLYLMDENEENLTRLIAMTKEYIDIAQRIGSKVTIGSIKGNYPRGADKQARLAIMGRCLQEISEYAVQKDVIVLLEATNHFENNVLNTGKDVYEMIEAFKLQNTQALMDSFHINLEERRIETCLTDAGKYLGHIHFGDNTRMYPGSGAFNFELLCRCIKDIGYDGVLSVECFPLPDGLTAAKETIAFFKKHFG